MEIDKIIQYLLIGNLQSGKIIYEMKNTNDLDIIYKIKNIFSTYSMKHNIKEENTKIESYYVNISIEKIIMISKADINFSIEQNIELFEKLKNNVPEVFGYPPKPDRRRVKQSLTAKITNIIYDFFQYINANKQIISQAYFKNKSNYLITTNIHKNNNNERKINFKLINKNNNNSNDISNNNSNNMSNLISIENNKNDDNTKNNYNYNEKSSTRGINLISIDRKKLKHLNNNKINYNNIKDIYKNKVNYNNNKNNKLFSEINKESDSTNINKSLYQSNILFKIDNNQNINIIESKQRSLYNTKKTNNCSKSKIIIMIILFIIIAIQAVSIPLIIINSYSY